MKRPSEHAERGIFTLLRDVNPPMKNLCLHGCRVPLIFEKGRLSEAGHKGLFFFLCILLIFLHAGVAMSTTVSGKASTVLEWYDNVEGKTVVPVYQYLMLNVKDIADNGYDFRSYGRLAEDLANEEETDSRLYYAYFEKRNFAGKKLDVRVGRQYISTAAGSSILDGIKLKTQYGGFSRPVELTFFGGGDLAYYSGYDEQDIILGIEALCPVFDSFDLGVSYIQKRGDGDLTHEIFGATVDYRYPDLLHFYADLQFNWITNDFTYILTGLKYHGSSKWSLRTEYLNSKPVFSASSIYAVFASEEYEEVLGELTYDLGEGLRAFGRFTREIYDEFQDANVMEAGVEQIRTRGSLFSGYLIGTLRDDDDGQNMEGVKIHLGYLVRPYVNVGLGAHYNVLERRLDEENDETTSTRFWLDSSVYLTKKIDLQFKLEQVKDEFYQDSFRGRLRFNVKF